MRQYNKIPVLFTPHDNDTFWHLHEKLRKGVLTLQERIQLQELSKDHRKFFIPMGIIFCILGIAFIWCAFNFELLFGKYTPRNPRLLALMYLIVLAPFIYGASILVSGSLYAHRISRLAKDWPQDAIIPSNVLHGSVSKTGENAARGIYTSHEARILLKKAIFQIRLFLCCGFVCLGLFLAATVCVVIYLFVHKPGMELFFPCMLVISFPLICMIIFFIAMGYVKQDKYNLEYACSLK